MTDKVSVLEFERQVLAAEGVSIIVRASANTLVNPYTPLPKNSRSALWVERFILGHLRPMLDGLPVEVISPAGRPIWGRVPLSEVRKNNPRYQSTKGIH